MASADRLDHLKSGTQGYLWVKAKHSSVVCMWIPVILARRLGMYRYAVDNEGGIWAIEYDTQFSLDPKPIISYWPLTI